MSDVMKVVSIEARNVAFKDDDAFYLRLDLNEVPDMLEIGLSLSSQKPERVIWYESLPEGWWAVGGIGVNEDAKKLEAKYQSELASVMN